MVNVWQAFRGGGNIGEAIKLWWKYDEYEDSYLYDLSHSGDFFKYNMEQQVSIVPDYWYVNQGITPHKNKGRKSNFGLYSIYHSVAVHWPCDPRSNKNPSLASRRNDLGARPSKRLDGGCGG